MEPSWTLPWATPWRVIMVGTTPAPIVESTLVENLNPPSIVADTTWIKPGRASWSWLFDPPSPQDCTKLKAFVDLAAEMGWEYTLVDANWDIMKNGTVHDVIAYAKSKGVGVLLWYNSGGPHNIVTERPRGLMDQRKVRRYEFERLAKWGVKGVKIDFFQSDKQNIMGLYHEILKDAADFKIMVNFHGCTLPRGWSRTYPHLMSMEAVRGEESYLFDKTYPALAPRHNATLPFTRNVVGPMDDTPAMFQDNKSPARHDIRPRDRPARRVRVGAPPFRRRARGVSRAAGRAQGVPPQDPGGLGRDALPAGRSGQVRRDRAPGRRPLVRRRNQRRGPSPRDRPEALLPWPRTRGRRRSSRTAPRRSPSPAGHAEVQSDGSWRIPLRPNGGFVALLAPGR